MNHLRVIFLVSSVFIFAFSHLGCTKKTPEKANVSFNFKTKNTSLAAVEIEHVIINISAPDLPLQSFDFECDNGASCDNLNVEVNSGSSRLIQLLIITQEAGNPVSKVNYGDVGANLSGGDNALTIDVVEKGSFFNEAKIMGRYIPTSGAMAGQRLTGVVDIKVATESGKPDMRIGSFEVFAGWFNTFAIDGLPFKFVFNGFNRNGVSYAEQPFFQDLHGSAGLVLSSSGLAPDGNRVNHFRSSESFYDQDGEGESADYVLKSFRNKIVGFFGQNPGNLSLCASKVDSDYAFDNSHGSGELCKESDGSDCLAFYQWEDIDVYPAASAANGDTDSCVQGNISQRAVDLEKIADDGDQFMGYVGPFAMTETEADSFGDIIQFKPATGEIKWKLILGSFMAGVDVFYSAPGDNIDEDLYRGRDNQLFCEKLSSVGFQHLGFSAGTNGSVTANPALISQPGFSLILCPKKHSGGYFRTAFQFRGDYTGDDSPARIHIAKHSHIDGFTGKMYSGTCYPIEVSLKNSNNDDTSAAGPIQVAVSANLASGRFFSDAGACDTPGGGSSTYNLSLKDKALLYYGHGASSGNFELSAASGNLKSGKFSFKAFPLSTPDEFRLISNFDRAKEFEMANTEECTPFKVVAFHDDEMVAFPAGSTIDFSNAQESDATAINIHSNATCGSPLGVGEAVNSVNNRLAHFNTWVVPIAPTVSAPPIENIISNCNNGGGTISCDSPDLEIVTPSIAGKSLQTFPVSGALDPGQCQKFKVGYFDDHKPNPYPLAFGSGGSLTINDVGSTNGVLHNGICTTAPELDPTTKAIAVTATDGPMEFYYRPAKDGEIIFQADYFDGASNDIITSTPVNIEQGPSQALIDVGGGPKIFRNGSGSFAITLTNDGNAMASSLDVIFNSTSYFDFLGGSYPGTGGSCGATLAPAASCTIVVDYSSGTGPDNDTFKLTYNDGTYSDAIAIVLEGTP